MKDSCGVVIIFNPDVKSQLKEIETWHSMFISPQSLQESQCLLVAHQKPGSEVENGRLQLGTHTTGLIKLFCFNIYGLTWVIFSRSLIFEQTASNSFQPGGGTRAGETRLHQIPGQRREGTVRKKRARGDVHSYVATEHAHSPTSFCQAARVVTSPLASVGPTITSALPLTRSAPAVPLNSLTPASPSPMGSCCRTTSAPLWLQVLSFRQSIRNGGRNLYF